LNRAILEIRQIVEDTFADCPMPGERDAGAPPRLAAALEAQYMHLFSCSFHFWPLATPIRHTPIRVLAQMARCLDRADYFDPEEARLDESYLSLLNRPAEEVHHG
jgi:hypothetical protein